MKRLLFARSPFGLSRRRLLARCVRSSIAAALLGCVPPSPRNPLPAPPAPTVAQLSERYWEELVRHSPVWATSSGDRSRDAGMDDPSEAATRRHLDALFALRVALDATPVKDRSAAETITVAALREELTGRIESMQACQAHLWEVDPLGGFQVALAQLTDKQSIATTEDARELAARWAAVDAYYTAHIAALRAGLAKHLVAPRAIVERVIAQLDAQLAIAAADSLYAKVKLPDAAPGFHIEERVRIRRNLVKAVETGVYPGLTKYRDFLRDEVLPMARPPAKSGVDSLPGGVECYRAQVRRSTGTAKTPQEIHDLGVAQVAAIEAEMLAIVKTITAVPAAGGEPPNRTALDPDLSRFMTELASRKGEGFATKDALVQHNRDLVERARAALPRAFGTLPVTPVEVRPVEEFREKDASRGQYHHAPPDGSRPGIYYVNAFRPETRPRFEMAALAFHEALPGHHLQIAIGQENAKLPRFQRELGATAFVEGWGLYSERLADELGLYLSPEEKLGMLDGQRIRAVRLVVDTGIHALGWSRDRAIEYQLAHTAGTPDAAARAIDRYITWPGQALAYMTGALELRTIRADAEKRLGAKFDRKRFHDRLLSNGGVPIDVARKDIDAWIAAGG